MEVKLRGHTEVRPCEDCGSSHIGVVPCGMTYLERMRSTSLDGSVTESRTKTKYWDDGPLQNVWGLNAKEREEQMMDDTHGLGYYDKDRPMSDKEAEVFFGADE